MHVWKSCFLFTLVAVLGLLVVPAAADPPECPAGSYGCPIPGCDVPTRPYDACPPACLPAGHCDLDPCFPDCCEDECGAKCCCEEDCCTCCDGESCGCSCDCPACCEGCPAASRLHRWIARQIVRAAGGCQPGCCRPACCKSTVSKEAQEAIQAACSCGCGCKNCKCGKGRVAGRCPFGFVGFAKPVPPGPIGHPMAMFHKMAKVMAENAVLKARLEMQAKHARTQRELEHALMEARQQIAQMNGAHHHHVANPQDRILAQWIETQAQQMARKDEVLVDLLGAVVQMQAEGKSGGAARVEAIEKLEAKIEKLEYSLKRVYEQNAKLRARMADLIKSRRSVQQRIKTDRRRSNCGEGADIDVEIETRTHGRCRRDTDKNAACEGACTRSRR